MKIKEMKNRKGFTGNFFTMFLAIESLNSGKQERYSRVLLSYTHCSAKGSAREMEICKQQKSS